MECGEHSLPEAQFLAKWLTEALPLRKTREVRRLWERYFNDDGEFPGLPADLYLDQLSFDSAPFDLPDFYGLARRMGATSFVVTDDNAWITLVAVVGDPGAQAITAAILSSGIMTMECGMYAWPNTLGEGTPIAELCFTYTMEAILRDGTSAWRQKPRKKRAAEPVLD